MNYGIIKYIVGWTLILEAALMVPSAIVALIYGETAIWAFVGTIVLCLLAGMVLKMKKPHSQVFFAREGFVSVALSWVALSVMGGLPFIFSGAIKNPVDAMFETVSGFTTTGASILSSVEILPKSILFWRSFTHWIGGMGVLVFLLTLIPMTGGFHMNIMKAESPGPSVSRLVPKVRSTAKILYQIYIGMTVLEIILLLIGRMPLFDALTLSFGTAGTGGFGIRNDSIASYSVYHQVIITIFMILFGVNFNAYFFILMGKARQAFQIEEVKGYFAVIGVATLVIAANIWHLYGSVVTAFQQAAFQVASIITTTGYATADFGIWPVFSQTILVLLMFIGACAGSTGGGIKVSRIVILFKLVKNEISHLMHPKRVTQIRFEQHVVSKEIIRAIQVFLISYLIIFSGSVLAISLCELDFTTNFTAVAATLNNIGPGLNLVGPTGNFGVFSDPAKWILMFDMLAGRLEIFPMLVLMTAPVWKRG